MKLLNKLWRLFLAMILILGTLTGCADAGSSAEGDKLNIVCTLFPQYDWVRQIMGDQADAAEITFLFDQGVDLHSYQPTTSDMIKIASCDLLIFVGGESEKWIEDALSSAAGEKKVIRLLEVLGDAAREEEAVEGMETAPHAEEDNRQDGAEYDEHVWLTPRNARAFCGVITDALCALDHAHAETYRNNCAAYQGELQALDAAYRDTVDNAARKTLLFGDRFPFRYLVEDYGLDYYAAFPGCSAEAEASFDTVIFLAGKLDALGLPAVLMLEDGNRSLAEAIVRATETKDQRILVINSLQAVTGKDAAAGATYLSMMRDNLRVLGEALN